MGDARRVRVDAFLDQHPGPWPGNSRSFGDVPSFFFIGGASTSWWNSPDCGDCCYLTNAATGVSGKITAVDIAGSGFMISITQKVFVQLNGGQVGHSVVTTKISPSVCGL
jgi:hypothetical protein